jgi:hypothetical protein
MIYLVIGRRLQGKTTLGYFITRNSPKRIIVDPRGLIRPRGAVVVSRTTDVKLAIGQLSEKDIPNGTVVVTPKRIEQGFNAVCRDAAAWIERDPRARFALLLDEFRFVKPFAAASPDFEWLLRCSDPERVHIILTCHRPIDIPVDVRSIADHWLMFRMTQPHDVRVVEERSVRASIRVQRLEPRVYVHWADSEDESDENPSTYASPDRWYVPLRSADTTELEPAPAPLDDLEPVREGELDGKLDF